MILKLKLKSKSPTAEQCTGCPTYSGVLDGGLTKASRANGAESYKVNAWVLVGGRSNASLANVVESCKVNASLA
jgi:hypothetical protein